MAVQAPSTANEAFRPSSWPVRNQRRHAATMTFQTRLFEELTSISSRLQGIEEVLKNVSTSTNAPPGLGGCGCQYATTPTSDMGVRIERMEMHFEQIDQVISAAANLVTNQAPEPEKETSPATGDDVVFFNIYDAREDKVVQTEDVEKGVTHERATQTGNVKEADFPASQHLLSGIWEPLAALSPGDVIRTDASFLSHDGLLKVEIPQATHGKVIEIDKEGDALINFPSFRDHLLDSMCWVRATDLKKCSCMQGDVRSNEGAGLEA